MCGILGLFNHTQLKSNDINFINSKLKALAHRGPDDEGVWIDNHHQLILGHRRLSILDKSNAGHQPMLSSSNRYVISFNGEIYNHLKLRAKLNTKQSSRIWKGRSDTETILALIDDLGILETLKSLTGMFAIAVWDRKKRILYMARDRVGEKPLYYYKTKNVFIFGSEIKVFKNYNLNNLEIDKFSLELYFKYGYVPCPYTIYKNVFKLNPGTVLEVNFENYPIREKSYKYWELSNFAVSQNLKFDEKQSIITLNNILSDSVSSQMLSDAPIGAFLSGGIDSSLIAAIMQSKSKEKIKTFTVGFNEKEFNEADNAKKIANYLGTDHSELLVSSNDALKLINVLPEVYDEPFSDPSSIPTLIISKFASSRVKVCLSGDGGDELFGGYNRYIYTHKYMEFLKKSPYLFRKIISRILGVMPAFGNKFYPGNLSYKLDKLISVLDLSNPNEIYEHIIRHNSNLSFVMGGNLTNDFKMSSVQGSQNDYVNLMMHSDIINYLPDNVLTKVDRAAMYNSLETRAPFLDLNVINFSNLLPLSMKIRNGKGKWILRQVLKNYIPENFFDKNKKGFAVPIGEWLNGPLKNLTLDTLSEKRLINDDFLNYEIVRKILNEHFIHRQNRSHELWSILIFQLWLDSQRSNEK